MTSGCMKCPKCGKQFTCADYVEGLWTEFPEPWKCDSCQSQIVVDKDKGYGLKVIRQLEPSKPSRLPKDWTGRILTSK